MTKIPSNNDILPNFYVFRWMGNILIWLSILLLDILNFGDELRVSDTRFFFNPLFIPLSKCLFSRDNFLNLTMMLIIIGGGFYFFFQNQSCCHHQHLISFLAPNYRQSSFCIHGYSYKYVRIYIHILCTYTYIRIYILYIYVYIYVYIYIVQSVYIFF